MTNIEITVLDGERYSLDEIHKLPDGAVVEDADGDVFIVVSDVDETRQEGAALLRVFPGGSEHRVFYNGAVSFPLSLSNLKVTFAN